MAASLESLLHMAQYSTPTDFDALQSVYVEKVSKNIVLELRTLFLNLEHSFLNLEHSFLKTIF